MDICGGLFVMCFLMQDWRNVSISGKKNNRKAREEYAKHAKYSQNHAIS